MPWHTTRLCGHTGGSCPTSPECASGGSSVWSAMCFTSVVRSSLTIARASHRSGSTLPTPSPKDWPRGCSPCSGRSTLLLLWAKLKYLQALTPMAQRFYEIVSYPMFAALTHRRPHATLRYSAYCLLSTQQRYTAYEHVKKQMYKVHYPHVQSGYLAHVRVTTTTDAEGQPDWFLHYAPGPKAQAEYAAFRRQPGVETALPRPEEAEQTDLLALVLPEGPAAQLQAAPQAPVVGALPPASPTAPTEPAEAEPLQAEALVQQFYQRFHGLTQVTPAPKELTQATALLTAHGEVLANFLMTYAHTAARETQYHPQVFGGLLHYTDRALAAYATRTA